MKRQGGRSRERERGKERKWFVGSLYQIQMTLYVHCRYIIISIWNISTSNMPTCFSFFSPYYSLQHVCLHNCRRSTSHPCRFSWLFLRRKTNMLNELSLSRVRVERETGEENSANAIMMFLSPSLSTSTSTFAWRSLFPFLRFFAHFHSTSIITYVCMFLRVGL